MKKVILKREHLPDNPLLIISVFESLSETYDNLENEVIFYMNENIPDIVIHNVAMKWGYKSYIKIY